MADAMMMELRALKIPFFAIKSTFIETTSTNSVESKRSISDPHSQQTLSRDELSVLQIRMLELLQDLCRE
ncbi:hypothetical protein ASPWEDRAFT_38476 [Aspergillus wentii DTO 134E9]|uniref:Uncharacterized protein n=1 Tax=Aspergillus wentii DTO 134E9 TaxID=1073089 RepID=A0A1L9RPT2_ASPWE|nr:uncharacterized protein ASPWEDRAFT_38476 [Aspergillus wentii DTO 134E9]OJJ36827.1 hypothetical protein ASPWEDRAFT_38476 [Aspergillus wentii DTO 134E9]